MLSRALTNTSAGCRYKRTLQRGFTHQDIEIFTGLTGDSNPIHKGSKAIVPGLLAASLFPAIIGSAHPGTLYASQELKFKQVIEVRYKLLYPEMRFHLWTSAGFEVNLKAQVNTSVTASVEVTRVSRGVLRWQTLVQLPDGGVAIEGTALSFLPTRST